MTKLKLLALGVLIATSAGVAHAEGKFSLGAGVGVVEHPYKDYDTDDCTDKDDKSTSRNCDNEPRDNPE